VLTLIHYTLMRCPPRVDYTFATRNLNLDYSNYTKVENEDCKISGEVDYAYCLI
jgi:hypothetical protein